MDILIDHVQSLYSPKRLIQGLLHLTPVLGTIFAWNGHLEQSRGSITSVAINITIYQPHVPFAPSPLPSPGAVTHADALVAGFMNLGRTTQWDLVSALQLEGDAGEPEGMMMLGDERMVLATGDWVVPTKPFGKDDHGYPIIINGTDRENGQGFAHLILYNTTDGRRIADATLTKPDSAEYHIGGIDYDGEYIWATLSQYRPNSTATIIKVDPTTLQSTPVLRMADHAGGAIHDTKTDKLITLNWGGRNASTWDLAEDYSLDRFSKPARVVRTPSYFVDYQDCKFVGHPSRLGARSTALCSGIATIASGDSSFNLGGIALIDTETMVPLFEVPIALRSRSGATMTKNPMDVKVVDGRLRLYWVPDEHNSTLYIYEARPNSPYEFGGSGG